MGASDSGIITPLRFDKNSKLAQMAKRKIEIDDNLVGSIQSVQSNLIIALGKDFMFGGLGHFRLNLKHTIVPCTSSSCRDCPNTTSHIEWVSLWKPRSRLEKLTRAVRFHPKPRICFYLTKWMQKKQRFDSVIWFWWLPKRAERRTEGHGGHAGSPSVLLFCALKLTQKSQKKKEMKITHQY